MSKGGQKGGLSFLKTKSWAMNNDAMIAKLSEAERKSLLEQQKAEEVQQEREKERHKEEVRKQQLESGHIINDDPNRIDWMYETPPGFQPINNNNQFQQQQQQQLTKQQREDLLLGNTKITHTQQQQQSTLKNVLETNNKIPVWDSSYYKIDPYTMKTSLKNELLPQPKQNQQQQQQQQLSLFKHDPLIQAFLHDSTLYDTLETTANYSNKLDRKHHINKGKHKKDTKYIKIENNNNNDNNHRNEDDADDTDNDFYSSRNRNRNYFPPKTVSNTIHNIADHRSCQHYQHRCLLKTQYILGTCTIPKQFQHIFESLCE